MKVYIIIILVYFSICYNIGKNVKEDEAPLGSASALLSQYLLMNSKINLFQSQQIHILNMRAKLTDKLNSLEKTVEKFESAYSNELTYLYKQLALCQTDSQKEEIKNQIEQKNKTFKEVLDNYKKQKLLIEEEEKDLENKAEILKSTIDELNKTLEIMKKNLSKEIQDTTILS